MKKAFKNLLFIVKLRLSKLPFFKAVRKLGQLKRQYSQSNSTPKPKSKPSPCQCNNNSDSKLLDVIVNQSMEQSCKEILNDTGWAMEFLKIHLAMSNLKTTEWSNQDRIREHDITVGLTRLHLKHYENMSKQLGHSRIFLKTHFEDAPMNMGALVHSETSICLGSLGKNKTHIQVFWNLEFKNEPIFKGIPLPCLISDHLDKIVHLVTSLMTNSFIELELHLQSKGLISLNKKQVTNGKKLDVPVNMLILFIVLLFIGIFLQIIVLFHYI